MENLRLVIRATEQGQRLDKALAQLAEEAAPHAGLSRARLQALMKGGHIARAGKLEPEDDGSRKVVAGEVYDITLPPPEPATPQAQSMPLRVVYEDQDVIVIDKPAGLVVHPAAGHWDGTLVNALLAHCAEDPEGGLSGIGGVARPGIVHRLDKDTSGLMVVAKNDHAHQKLTAQFADRSLSRTYQALVWGVPNPVKGAIEGAIGRHPRARQKMAVVAQGGKDALTYYETTEVFGTVASLVSCHLATGRTHQIRVHMAHIKHPVIGDPAYGTRQNQGRKGADKTLVAALEAFPRQALHAAALRFVHPRTGKTMSFQSPMPEDMAALRHRLLRGA